MSKQTGAERIAEERATHEARGYAANDDDFFESGELVMAAICYASPAVSAMYNLWPWINQPPLPVFNIERRIEQLAKAGALIAAEIDRLERHVARVQVEDEAEISARLAGRCAAPGGCGGEPIAGCEFCEPHQRMREEKWPWLREARLQMARVIEQAEED